MASGMEQRSREHQLSGVAPAGKARRSNRRTALVLLSIALVFFAGVIVNRILSNPSWW